MENSYLIKAKSYFEKAKNKRVGTFMTEVRKQFVLDMHREGAKSRHIKKITHLRHDQIWYYINRHESKKEVQDEVLANMDEWMDKGLYPIPISYKEGDATITWYVLNEDPGHIVKSVKETRKTKWDRLIESMDLDI